MTELWGTEPAVDTQSNRERMSTLSLSETRAGWARFVAVSCGRACIN